MFGILSVFAELQRELIVAGTRDGLPPRALAAATEAGAETGRRAGRRAKANAPPFRHRVRRDRGRSPAAAPEHLYRRSVRAMQRFPSRARPPRSVKPRS
jgi:hypothetical protein